MAKTSLQQNLKDGFPKVHNVDHLMKSLGGEESWLGEGGVLTTVDLPDLGNNGTSIRYFINNHNVPVTLTAIKAMKGGSADTATATLSNLDAEGGAANPLSGTNIDMHALTNDAAPASQTLNGTAANITVPAGGRVKISLACGASGTLTGGKIQFWYDANQ